MLFAQLAKDDINIHINIAAIVIEMVPHAFNTDLDVCNRNYGSGKLKLDSIAQLIKKHLNLFTADTFDYFHLATTAKWTEDVDNHRGLSTEWFDAYSQRIQKPNQKDWKFAGSILRHGKYVEDYSVAAREIAYLMEIKHDIKTENLLFNDAQCLGVTQEYNPSCLKWNPKTIEGFKRYLSESRNRCFLLNYPRSLHPYNVPVELISPAKQCSCYNQDVDHSKV
ncbi:hypothetical protein PV325_009846 [Microctonus aethiopoides]|uniref:Uncharacterized protein n=1 Tax=Microctonus aethiopoides TaxID=144406 RepID=A0AA39FAF6_9HYME|nr:hypothetical protein PV325_009846 [Microctonus aethiopoides]KAK0165932.1 hypothetical protein PV328_004408 [Microctonus aethiopoides]